MPPTAEVMAEVSPGSLLSGTSGALAPAFVIEHALCVSNMHLIARDMQFCSPTCMLCVEHAL